MTATVRYRILRAGLLGAGALLALSRQPAAKRVTSASSTDRLGRISPPRGLLARGTSWYVRRRYGEALSPVRAFAHHPKLLIGYGGFESALERSHRVDKRLKALAELKAATLVECEWCMDFGSLVGAQAGVPEEQLRELPRYRESTAFSELEKLVLNYAVAVTRTPAEVSDELFARLREHFDDAQLVELTATITIENLRARFNDALGLESQGFSDGAFCVVPEREGAAQADGRKHETASAAE